MKDEFLSGWVIGGRGLKSLDVGAMSELGLIVGADYFADFSWFGPFFNLLWCAEIFDAWYEHELMRCKSEGMR